ncbi:metallophosphoesterase [Pseudidiomarina taiwanensis]|uniref:Metallophosphoesterase n=1 Tax=Pseudidiomarina taiwanensis TaxID=337250 RepID=A0A432ZEK2_9GAMM|nr:metallophosphoesterase [Pseudidiomarina taiwanensis]RUO76351.1 metallophosphoesterase [Pseudidiomarina taiwanensis]
MNKRNDHVGYDVIGDIHGHADELEILLAGMGYQLKQGVWQHPNRILLSVGDLVDRGPQQRHSIDVVRSMWEEGKAKVIMGNHEFNAVAYATLSSSGDYLRPHTLKNRDQHEKFLNVAEADPNWYKQTIEWFSQLPLYLETEHFRAVHACWHDDSIATLQAYLDDYGALRAEAWEPATHKGHELYQAIEVLLKGWEVSLPDGHSFLDYGQHERTAMRVKWWGAESYHYRELALGVPKPHTLPDMELEAAEIPHYDANKPLFIGHYWMRGEPSLVHQQVACLDWSVTAQNNGQLVAYRDHAQALATEQFVSVPNLESIQFDAALLSEALFFADPMATGCRENDCFDEYDGVALEVLARWGEEQPLRPVLATVLAEFFAPEWVTDEVMTAIFAELARVVREVAKGR